jgi:iron complex outermembrane receptor protein
MVWTPTDTTSVTVDYYNIQIDDRMTLFNNPIDAADVALLTAAGIPNANLLLGANTAFFVNGFDSEVDGLDLAVTSNFEVGGGDLLVDLRYNHNEQKVTNVTPNTINAANVFDLENTIPNDRALLTFNYSTEGMFSGLVRFNYYGNWWATGGLFSTSPQDAGDAHRYNDEFLVDLEANFTFSERYRFTLGAENVFDTEPDPEQDGTLNFLGVRPSLTSPFGFNGAFWYARASVNF